MRLARVTLDGEPVALSTDTPDFPPPAWPIVAGVHAPEVVWHVDPRLADQVLAKRETRITLQNDDEPERAFERVVVVGERPSNTPFARAIALSDVRWYFRYNHVRRSFNLRQRTGSQRLDRSDGVPAQVGSILDELAFAPFSLVNEQRAFTAQEMAQSVLQELAPFNWEWRARARGFVPNDVEVDDPGHEALLRVLGVTGGVDVFVNRRGKVVVFDRILGAEKAVVERHFSRAFEDLGLLTWVRQKHARPKRIFVLYNRELELRVDAVEQAGSAETPDQPVAENVIPVTDESLTVTRRGRTTVEPQGAWVELNAYLAAIRNLAPVPATPPGPLTLARIQDCFLGTGLLLHYVTGLNVINPSTVAAGRVGALLANYRQTYRLDSKFMARILPGSLRAVRVALIDGPTGTWQPSPVYLDHLIVPTQRELTHERDDGWMGWNVHCLPPRDAGQRVGETKAYPATILLQDCQPAPALVQMLDPAIGLYRIVMKKDAQDHAERIYPSLAQDLPTIDPEKVATLAALATLEECKLVRNHRVIAILSCMPAGPNNDGSLHRENVGLADALRKLGLQPLDADGPDLELRVFPSILTPRYPWSDEQREEILGAFDPKRTFPSKLVAINAAEVRDHAQAVAATAIAGLLDHYAGQAATDGFPELEPIGSLHTIVYTVDPLQRALTTVNCDPRPGPVRPEHLMLDSTRRTIRRELPK